MLLLKKMPRKSLLLLAACVTLFILPIALASAQGYVSLSGVPELNKAPGSRDVTGYLNALYLIVISAGALLAVIKIALAGVKIATTDIVPSIEEAKKDITGALLGLAILLLPYIVLSTIYPGLVNLNFLGGVQPVKLPAPESFTADSQIREQIANTHQNVASTATVKPRSKEHLDFVKNCTNDGGRTVLNSKSTEGYNLECRTSGQDTNNSSTQESSNSQTSTQIGSTFTINDPGSTQHGVQGNITNVSQTNLGYRYTLQLPDGSTTNVGCFGIDPVPPECR